MNSETHISVPAQRYEQLLAAEQRLAVQTALAESLAAKAQSLRLLVERAVELLKASLPDKQQFDSRPQRAIRAFLSEILERKE
ncbi:hypothetical protein [Nitrospira sp. BLG_2]|uniref:hypothetical protein n=1 Tax=Nitrospira sp. BLG_2 TaxID=3397507 RepID=UPI003B9AEA58